MRKKRPAKDQSRRLKDEVPDGESCASSTDFDELIRELERPETAMEFWETLGLSYDESTLARMGFSDEFVPGFVGVMPKDPLAARYALNIFVEQVKMGRPIPWSIIRYLAYAFDRITEAGVDADTITAEHLGLRYSSPAAKKSDARLGKSLAIGQYIQRRLKELQRAKNKDPVTTALGEAAEKFKVSERKARADYERATKVSPQRPGRRTQRHHR